MVTLRMARQGAEALYDAAIESMARHGHDNFLFDAAMEIRLSCGMNKGEGREEEAARIIDEDVASDSGKMTCQTRADSV